MSTFTRQGNGNIIFEDANGPRKLNPSLNISPDTRDPNFLYITEHAAHTTADKHILKIDWRAVTIPAATSREDLITQLSTDFFFNIAANGLIDGTAENYTALPPAADHTGEFWLVENGSGGLLSWIPFTEIYKYPKGVYSPNSNDEWVITPFNVQLAEDALNWLNITNWAEYFAFGRDINPGDKIMFNMETYVNLTGVQTSTTPDFDAENWRNASAVKWVYPYVSETYPRHTMTRVGDWTAIANKETSDYPVPQLIGEEFNVYDGVIGSAQVNARQVLFGTRYTATASAYVKGYRVNVVAGNEYKLYSITDPLGAKIIKLELEFVADETGWVDISIAPTLVLTGQVFDIITAVQEPDPTPVTFNGNWNYQKPTNITPPTSGQITHSSKEANKLLINYIDNDSVDQTTNLQSLEIGDLIRVNELQWAIQAITLQLGYIELDIAPATQSVNLGVTSFEFETKVETPITYAIDLDYYLSNPNVSGLFAEDDSYNNITVNNNAYGVDLLIQEVIQSEDWDIIASSANLGGGGNKKASDFLSQVEVTTEGDDKGVEFKYQLSALGEIIAGKDSYPVPIAFHCTTANTTGKTIVNAINVTQILQSDQGSAIGLFGSNAAGSYILVGAPEVYEGAKVKYDSLGNVEADNIIAEFYENDINTWQNVPFMGTNSAFPYQSNADKISLHDSEQIFFGFNPLTRDQPESWELITFNINGTDYTFRWARYRIVTAITSDPVAQQVKLHSNRIELEANGIFKYGKARSPLNLLEGVRSIVSNTDQTPLDQAVSYANNITAGYFNNRFDNGKNDGFLAIVNRKFGLDTSVPLVLALSFYVEGTNIGDLDFLITAIQVVDGFEYTGAALPDSQYNQIETIAANAGNNQRRTVQFVVPINKLQANSGIVISVTRVAQANPNDTVASDIVITNVVVNGFTWKI